MIPQIVHRIWLGDEPLPEEFRQYGETWKAHHPHWEHRLWTEDNLPQVERGEINDRFRMPTERSDLLRYELLLQFGGLYVDTDFECLRPIDELLEGVEFMVGEEKKPGSGRVNTALMASAPGHPVAARLVRESQPVRYERTPSAAEARYDYSATGPLFLGRVLEDEPDVTRYPPRYFYPRTDAEVADAYAVHHPRNTWLSKDPWERELISIEEGLRFTEKRLRVAQNALAKEQARIEKTRARLHEAKTTSESTRATLEAIEATRWWRTRSFAAAQMRRLLGRGR